MKNLKKVLALVLAFACAFTMFAGAAFTDEADINADNRDAVELLTALNIIQGYEDGSFDPEGTVTRAEMAKMIYTIRNGGNDDASAYETVTTTFQDINGHWAEGYIKYLQNTGIVAGNSPTEFDPDSQVTTGEAMKMALVLAGYDATNAELTGISWLNNTVALATTVGMTDDVASSIASGCTRQDAAQILSNTLVDVYAVRYSSIVEDFVNDSKTGLSWGGDPISVGEKWMDLSIDTGYITKGPSSKTNPKGITFVGEDVGRISFRDTTIDVSDLAGYEVKVVWDNANEDAVDGVYGVYKTDNNTSWTTMWKDVDADGAKVEFDGESLTLQYNDRADVYINGYDTATRIAASDFDQAGEENIGDIVTFIDNDGDGDVNVVQIWNQNVVEVTYVGEGSMDTGELIADQSPVTTSVFSSYDVSPDLDDVITYDGIAKDDYAKVSYNYYNDKLTYEKIDEVEATVQATRTNQGTKEIRIDGNWYKAAEGYTLPSIVSGDTVAYVAIDNLIYNIEKTDGTWGSKNLALVYDVGEYTVGVRRNELEVALINRDGDKIVTTLDKFNNESVSYNGTDYEIDLNHDGTAEPVAFRGAGNIEDTLEGMLVTYRESGDEVSLMPVYYTSNTDNQKAGYDDVYTATNYVAAGNDITVSTLNGQSVNRNVNIADSAVVFIFDGSDADVLTGKELDNAGVTASGVSNVAVGGEENGADYIQAVGVEVADVDSVTATGSNYAYVISAAETVDGDDYRWFELWTEDGLLEAYEQSSDEYTYDGGEIVTYDLVSTGDRNIIDNVERVATTDAPNGATLIGAITSSGFYGNNDNYIAIDRGEYELASDCVVLNVNTDDKSGIDGDAKSGARAARKDTSTPVDTDYIPNIVYVLNADKEIEFILIDGRNNEITDPSLY